MTSSPALTGSYTDSLLDFLGECMDSEMEPDEPTASQGKNRVNSRNRGQQTEDSQLIDANLDTERIVVDRSVSPPVILHKPKRHITTDRKKHNWDLTTKERYILLGDSNLSRIPSFKIPNLQIDSYPGATFRHVYNIINKTQINPEVEIMVYSVGINNRKQKIQTATKEIQRLHKISKEKFPNATIIFPLINCSKNLTYKEQEFIQELNKHLQLKYETFPKLPDTRFSTERDDIHWTKTTAESILSHWTKQVN